MSDNAAHQFVTFLSAPRHGWQLAAFLIVAVALGIGALLTLMNAPPRHRKRLVMGVTFVAGLYFSLEFLIGRRNVLTDAKPTVADWTMVIGSFALLLGITNLFQIHGKAVARRGSGWGNSAAFFVAFFAILSVGFLKDAAAGSAKAASEALFTVFFSGFLAALDATMFSLIAFYIVSAAYRAFRVRSVEAALMMATAGIIMLGLVPIGAHLTSWLPDSGFLANSRLERLTAWLLAWPNMAAQRAIAFGIGVGALAMSLRIWLSLERGSFFDRQL